MIKKNDPQTVGMLKMAAQSSQGRLIIQYFKEEVDREFSFDDLDPEKSDKELGQQTKALIKIRGFMDSKIKFLTSK